MSYIEKGQRIRAQWFQAKPMGSYALTGCQNKVTGDFVEVSGVVAHMRCEDPAAPTMDTVRLYVDPDDGNLPRVRPHGCTCSQGHVEVNPKHVVAIG